MSALILFIFYGTILSLLIWKKKLFSFSGINAYYILGIFWCKVVAGMLYYFIHQKYYGGGDVVQYNHDAAILYTALPHDTFNYLKLILYPGGDYLPNDLLWYIKHTSYWSDKGTYLVVKLLAIFDLLSLGNAYINTLFYVCATFPGLLLLYKWGVQFIPAVKSYVLLSIFLLPQLLFWSSGIHKDGIIVSALGWILYTVDRCMVKKWDIKLITMALFCCLVLLVMRGYEFLLLCPGLAALIWCSKKASYSFLKIGISYALFFAAFFSVDALFHLGFLNYMIQKQHLFYTLGNAHSSLKPFPLSANWYSFVYYAPAAVFRTFTTPNPFTAKAWFERVAGIEHLIYSIAIGVIMVKAYFAKKRFTPQTAFLCWYAIVLFLFIGWIVPTAGAIIRYSTSAFLIFSLFILIFAYSKSETHKRS